MTTDEQMDARLRAAGEGWRAASAQPPGVEATNLAGSDVHELIAPPAKSGRNKILVGLSAAAVVALGIGLAVGLAGRNSNGPKPAVASGSGAIEQVHWQLATIDGTAGDYGSTLFVDGDKIQLNDGCNSGSGSGTVTGSTLEFRDIAITAMGCPGARGESSARVDRILVGTVTWSVDNGTLTVTKSGVGTLTYRAAPPEKSGTDPALLTGTWTLTGIEHNDGNTSSGSGSTSSGVTLTFTRAGAFKLASRCEAYEGSFTAQGRSIVFSGTHGTGPGFCTVPDAAQAGKVLGGRARYEIVGRRLDLTQGATTLTFTATR
jgi:heat shock protein HslJ